MDENLALDSYSDEDIEKLIYYGKQVVEQEKEDIHKALNDIIQEKFG